MRVVFLGRVVEVGYLDKEGFRGDRSWGGGVIFGFSVIRVMSF